MTTRLVWNFEINQTNFLDFSGLDDQQDELRWEARYFWPAKTIVCLNGLDKRFLAFSNYKAKHRQDRYALLSRLDYNIKERKGEWLYKPLMTETDLLCGYGKKINLADYPANSHLPGNKNLRASDLLTQITATDQRYIEVNKEALIYKFPSVPVIKLELARLEFSEKIYFSLCIEGHAQKPVSTLARRLLGQQASCDYVRFLKQALHYD